MGKGKRCGFTLIELLVVVSILALLLAILLPSLRGAKRVASQTACAAGLRGIGQGLRMYLNENNDLLPVVVTLPSIPNSFETDRPRLVDTLDPYLQKTDGSSSGAGSVWQCPSDTPGKSRRGAPNANKTYFETEGSSYVFNTFEIYRFMNDEGGFLGFKNLKQTTMYNLVRKERAIRFYGGQPAEEQVWLVQDYVPEFHSKDAKKQPRWNFLYIDGHVSDLER